MTKEERENLIIEYKLLDKGNWQRGQNVWLVNSILVTGSLIVAFQPSKCVRDFPTPLISLVLVFVALIMNITTDEVTRICNKRMNEIAKEVGINRKMYESEIRGKWWFVIRTNTSYTLFIILIGTYLFLMLHDVYTSLIVLVACFFFLALKEVCNDLRRE